MLSFDQHKCNYISLFTELLNLTEISSDSAITVTENDGVLNLVGAAESPIAIDRFEETSKLT
jgi:hypothetical protein